LKAGEATLTPVGVVEGLRELGYELYPVLERELHDHKLAPYPMTRVIGTRFKGKGKPPAALLEAAAEHRPYVAALVCATDPPPAIPWVAHVVESYLSGRVFMIKRRRCRFTARTVAANLGALCGLETLEEWERLEPMIKEVLPR
jgi:hypothetical protein